VTKSAMAGRAIVATSFFLMFSPPWVSMHIEQLFSSSRTMAPEEVSDGSIRQPARLAGGSAINKTYRGLAMGPDTIADQADHFQVTTPRLCNPC
jgi:hypothetical protein